MSMLGISGAKLGLHIIQFPSGHFGYVGSIPTDLGEKVPADRAAILGCRSFRDPETDESMMWKFPSFETVEEAIAHAKDRGQSPKWQNQPQ